MIDNSNVIFDMLYCETLQEKNTFSTLEKQYSDILGEIFFYINLIRLWTHRDVVCIVFTVYL